MHIELINTGSELMLGRVLNTHQQWICRQLADRGYVVTRQVAVADTGEHIRDAVADALTRADLVITTGGLGPTSDDLTRDYIARLLGLRLQLNPEALAHVEAFFAARKRVMPTSCAVQAQIPEGARVLMNANGTAPGLILRVEPGRFRKSQQPSWLVMLPGPPRELRPMFSDQVIALLSEMLPLEADFVCRTLKTTGIGESFAEERIAGRLQHLVEAGMELGYCARTGEVDLRLVARGCGASQTVAEAEAIIRAELGDYIYGEDDVSLEETIVRLMAQKRLKLAIAESCTGGFIAHRITNVPGASEVLNAGLVTYSNDSKMRLLGVDGETLSNHGAVSEATARQMAEGAIKRAGADFALAVTGIAGPGGGTQAKPVGTVFIALAGPGQTKVINPVNRYDRETFKWVTSQQALELLRRSILGGGL